MKILALSGSLQAASSNSAVLRCAAKTLPPDSFATFDGLEGIPPFNASLEDEKAPASVYALREAIRASDGVLISTPEYAHSVPGILKNALDWLVGSGELCLKPVAVISVSSAPTAGLRAQMALLQTLLAHSAEIVALLPIGSSKTVIGRDGAVVHASMLRRIGETVRALVERCEERNASESPS
jgi:NAD(P)H-dependent FMN reductase